ncbi:MAG: beta-aspartyl-peptidase, partial [Clostridiaceae bacterium]
MLKVIRNVEVYSPEYLGIKTVVIVGDKIEGIYDKLEVPEDFISIEVIEGKELLLVPGFIDNHVHIVGGGGEGGFATRTPEIQLSDLTTAGITTVIGCLGTDNVCRNLTSLYAKACGLESEGLTTRIYTGSYEIPVKPLTSSIKEDMMLIDKVIGVGEIALSDHRSSQPTYEEFIRTVALARV